MKSPDQDENSSSQAIDLDQLKGKDSTSVECVDGLYYWVHSTFLWKDPFTFLRMAKIVLVIGILPGLAILVFDLITGSPMKGLVSFFQLTGICLAILALLFAIAYPFFILVKGGRFTVLYRMDESRFSRMEMPESARRGRWIMELGVLLGTWRNSIDFSEPDFNLSEFKDVRRIIVYRRHSGLKLFLRGISRELIFTRPEDFDFIRDLIIKNCPPEIKIEQRN
jgi:hypothetical protein